MSATAQTIGSREARNNWRDVLDRAVAGEETIITRNEKPTAVVVPFGDWQRKNGDRQQDD